MSDEDFEDLVMHSSVFRHYRANRESITRHQAHLEQTEHRRIDFETALVDWILKPTNGVANQAGKLANRARDSRPHHRS